MIYVPLLHKENNITSFLANLLITNDTRLQQLGLQHRETEQQLSRWILKFQSVLHVVSRSLSQHGASIVLVVQTFLRGRTALHEEIISLSKIKATFL